MDTGPDAHMLESDLPTTEEEKLEVKSLTFQEDIGSFWWLAQVSRPIFTLRRIGRPSGRTGRLGGWTA